jgi:phosphoglycerate dehydrogenase-like enzyme
MNLLLTGAFVYSEDQISEIESLGYTITYVQDERLPLKINVTNIDAVVCNSLFIYNSISMFKNIRFIQVTSAGLDRIPLDYINEHGIKLFNAKGVYSIPMAEWTILKILEIYKKSYQFYNHQSECRWKKEWDLFELAGKTVSIIGYGDVGTEIAKRLKAFATKVIGVDVKKDVHPNYMDEYYYIGNIEIALRKSDIVVLSLPLTDDTKHIINKSRIESMKNNAILINVSRGGIVDEDALIQAIRQKKLLGAALDVFEEEPLPSKSELWTTERIIVTPHNSYMSEKVKERLYKLIIHNLSIGRLV